ncbi:hypothetical protein [Marichromatium bheemlicum]|uniref:Uncharacterized protein n=1 Tax=Marichromatium bheemlicum TaxID=365339 RepID=A0ABX1ID07_9GAMM|nr:hypothetical protein [Marichromatium bheemlicum]NKN33966.1 hypothetical protein [Marichromatium bheemlicum]
MGEALVGRGTRLSLAELPAAWRNWAARERPDLDLDLTWAVFVDYWRAQPGRQGVRLDWLRTWRNWVRRERRQRGGDERGRRPTGTTGERRAAVAETIRDNLARHDWTTTSPWDETGPTPPCGD